MYYSLTLHHTNLFKFIIIEISGSYYIVWSYMYSISMDYTIPAVINKENQNSNLTCCTCQPQAWSKKEHCSG